MEELYLFYWLSWLVIIIVYFFMEKTRESYFLLSCLFTILITINIQVNLFTDLSVNVAFIIILISAFFYYARFPFSLYHLMAAFIFIFAYVALLLWEKITPVWFVITPQIMIPFILVLLLIFICKDANLRVATAWLGITIGQFIFDLILIRYRLHMEIGALFSFNILYTIVLMILIYYFVSITIRYFKQKFTY